MSSTGLETTKAPTICSCCCPTTRQRVRASLSWKTATPNPKGSTARPIMARGTSTSSCPEWKPSFPPRPAPQQGDLALFRSYTCAVKIDVEQAKAQLDALIDRSAAGEEVVITR